MLECDGYWASREVCAVVNFPVCALSSHLLRPKGMAMFARLYDPTEKHKDAPLAWPLLATEDDLRGLMPHRIIVFELDPIREEGERKGGKQEWRSIPRRRNPAVYSGVEYYRKLVAAGVDAHCDSKIGLFHNADIMLANHAPSVFVSALRAVHDFALSLPPSLSREGETRKTTHV